MEITSGVWQFDIDNDCIIDRLGGRSFDYVRTGLNKNLGFTPEDREENIRRVAEVSIVLYLELQVEEGEPGLKLNPGSKGCQALLIVASCHLPVA